MTGTSFIFDLRSSQHLLHRRSGIDPVVDAGDDAEEDDACRAKGHSHLGAVVTTERRQRAVGLLDVHGLDDEQVVVE